MALADNLVSYWKLDESSGNASDSVGSNTLTNTSATYSAGKINNGAVFNGSSSKLNATISGTSTFTISCWIKPDNVTTEQYIATRRNTSNNANYGLTILTTGKVRMNSYNGSTSGEFDSSTTLSTGTYYHIVAVFNGSSSILYINGSSDATGTVQTHTSGSDFFVGANSTLSYYDGMTDEVGIWSRALSSTEVTSLYNSGNGISYSFAAPTVTTSAVSSITSTTATGNGNVTADGGNNITERGVCWSTSTNPTTSSSKATASGTTGAFTASITGLSAGTLYYVRAYAINSVGTSYGSNVTFTTLAANTGNFFSVF